MSADTPRTISEDDMHSLVDGQLSVADRLRIEASLEQDPQAQARVRQWRRQREALRGLHSQILDQPIPASLAASMQHASELQRKTNQWWRWGGMAAGLLLSFGMGWLTHIAWNASTSQNLASARKDFVRQASFAYAVYSPEVRHPVEVLAAEQDHLAKWLSKRTGRSLKIPVLSAEGFDLVGGRLLPGDEGVARAQFMFESKQGTRLTLYLGALHPSAPGPSTRDQQSSALTRETAFSFSPEGPVPSFYWIDQGFGFALSGPLPRDQLLKLARAVYQQL